MWLRFGISGFLGSGFRFVLGWGESCGLSRVMGVSVDVDVVVAFSFLFFSVPLFLFLLSFDDADDDNLASPYKPFFLSLFSLSSIVNKIFTKKIYSY